MINEYGGTGLVLQVCHTLKDYLLSFGQIHFTMYLDHIV